MKQITDTILMVRPAAFGFNSETAATNFFQTKTSIDLQEQVLGQFDQMVDTLRGKRIDVIVVNDTDTPPKPDAIFPNNWFCAHHSRLHVFPLCAVNRRLEKREDILQMLQEEYHVSQVNDWSAHETGLRFLEGTGSMVMDHVNRKIYACLSLRTDEMLVKNYAELLGYDAIVFTALDDQQRPVYHTNVLMCIGEDFALLCADAIHNEKERQIVVESLTRDNHEIILISLGQMQAYAGNMLQLQNREGKKFIVLSQTAMNALHHSQIEKLQAHGELLPLEVSAIETEGGSVRCMIAEIFLEKRS